MNRYEVNRDVFSALLLIISSADTKITFNEQLNQFCIGNGKTDEDSDFKSAKTLTWAVNILQDALIKNPPKPIN